MTTTHTELFLQEFVNPLYEKYEDDPRFTFTDEDGEKMWDLQYAFIQECQTDNLYEPILWEEEDGRQLVIGFRVNGQPQFILSDAQYSKKENGAPLMMMMTDATKFFMETGEQVSFVGYVGFDDVYAEEVN
tara:strand:+ start:333 stop:725 length:393 start_codon:yes stop_codon:yes gene_type:complete